MDTRPLRRRAAAAPDRARRSAPRRAVGGVLLATALLAGPAAQSQAAGPAAPASAPAATHVAAWTGKPHAAAPTASPQAAIPVHDPAPPWQRWGLRLAAVCIGAAVGWGLLRLGGSSPTRDPER